MNEIKIVLTPGDAKTDEIVPTHSHREQKQNLKERYK